MFGYVTICEPELKMKDWRKYRSYYCEYVDGEVDGTMYLSSRSTKKYYSIHIYPNAVLIWDHDKNIKTWYYNNKIPVSTY